METEAIGDPLAGDDVIQRLPEDAEENANSMRKNHNINAYKDRMLEFFANNKNKLTGSNMLNQTALDRYNMKKGQEAPDAVNYGRVRYDPISGEETISQIRSQAASGQQMIREGAGAIGGQGYLAGSGNISKNAGQNIAQVNEQVYNANSMGSMNVDQINQRIGMLESTAYDQNKAKTDEYYEKGLKGLNEKTIENANDIERKKLAEEYFPDYEWKDGKFVPKVPKAANGGKVSKNINRYKRRYK
jgi:hypothetical protein